MDMILVILMEYLMTQQELLLQISKIFMRYPKIIDVKSGTADVSTMKSLLLSCGDTARSCPGLRLFRYSQRTASS